MGFHLRKLPFIHLLLAPVFPPNVESACLSLLESCSWETKVGEFYRFDVPACRTVKEQIGVLIDVSPLQDIRDTLESIFCCQLKKTLQLEVHRYRPGHGIGPHTDASIPEIRCIVSYNRAWHADDGGVWILAADSALKLHKTYLPATSNTGFAFETGPTSYHALSICRDGVHYGLTLRFCRLETRC